MNIIEWIVVSLIFLAGLVLSWRTLVDMCCVKSVLVTLLGILVVITVAVMCACLLVSIASILKGG